MKKLTTSVIAMLVCSASTLALAHADEEHAKKAGPVKKEQKEWGIGGDAKAVKQTITLSMSDTMRFTPDKIDVKQGDTVKIMLKNTGTQMHELVIGT